MQLNNNQIENIKNLIEAWGEAEKAIKIVEQVCEEVNIPAVKELRYSGRKIVYSLSKYIDQTDHGTADKLIGDAIFDCHRARHDATDAAVAHISLRLATAHKKLGGEVITRYFPEFSDITTKMSEINEAIARARNSQDERHDTYVTLESEHLPEVVRLYNKFRANEPFMRRSAIKSFLTRHGITFGLVIMLAVLFALNAFKN